MARKPTPAQVLKLQGTYRKDRHSDRPEFDAVDTEPPVKPSFLKGAAAKEWKRVTELMAEQNLLHGLSRSLLTQYCIMWQQLEDSIDGEPLGAAFHTSFRLVCSELCFTPASFSKTAALVPKKEKPSGFQKV